jgi:hypothetical protein
VTLGHPKPSKTQICYENVNVNTLAMPCGHALHRLSWHDFCVNAVVREGRVCQDDLSGGVCNEVVTEDEMTRALEAGSTGASSGAVAELLVLLPELEKS